MVQAKRRVAFREAALAIRQVLGTVHSDLLQLIVDRVQPPPPRARKTSGGLPPGTASLSMATSTSTASGGLTPGTASVATASTRAALRLQQHQQAAVWQPTSQAAPLPPGTHSA